MRKKVLSLITIGVLATIISGCAANRVDLVDTGVLTLDRQREGKVYIAWSSAYEQDDGFVITGVLMRHDHVGSAIKTHVDVTVLSPDGRVLETVRSNEVYVPRRITGRGQSLKRFRVHLANLPPRGSSVRMVSHSGPHKDSA
ncbi:MAG: hypothetical protein ABIF19_13925 [Planctomycetota bacterium]